MRGAKDKGMSSQPCTWILSPIVNWSFTSPNHPHPTALLSLFEDDNLILTYMNTVAVRPRKTGLFGLRQTTKCLQILWNCKFDRDQVSSLTPLISNHDLWTIYGPKETIFWPLLQSLSSSSHYLCTFICLVWRLIELITNASVWSFSGTSRTGSKSRRPGKHSVVAKTITSGIDLSGVCVRHICFFYFTHICIYLFNALQLWCFSLHLCFNNESIMEGENQSLLFTPYTLTVRLLSFPIMYWGFPSFCNILHCQCQY